MSRVDPELFAALEAGETLPWSWYTDPELLGLEQERIFRRCWQYAGHAGEVAKPGSYFTRRLGGVPIVVVRGRDGELRGFVNVCRHRGNAVVRGAGRRASLQCSYHAWTYDLDGTLRAAPRSDREPGFDASQLSLLPVSVDAWGPFVFVDPDPDAAPLAETLRDLPERVAAAGIDVDRLEFRFRSEFEVSANWKVACENFLECYHCPVAHPGFSKLVDVSPDSYALETAETYSTQLGPLRDGGGFLGGGEVPRSQFHLLWPNIGINIYPGQPNFSIGPITPAAPERTERFLDYFFGAGVDESWVEELIEFDSQVGREDVGLVEGVQQGISAGVVEHGRLLVSSELLIQDFQCRVARALAPDSTH